MSRADGAVALLARLLGTRSLLRQIVASEFLAQHPPYGHDCRVALDPSAKYVVDHRLVTASACRFGFAAAKSPAAPKKPAALSLRDRLLETLLAHPSNRPSSRLALERHIATMAGNVKLSTKAVAALIAALERDGIVTIGDKSITYVLSNRTK